jgi:hypothetical protein
MGGRVCVIGWECRQAGNHVTKIKKGGFAHCWAGSGWGNWISWG